MASRQQVATKAAKLGGSLVIYEDMGCAYLNAPNGFVFDGYHYISDNFDDGKQSAWDYFWSVMKQMEVCPVDNCECKGEADGS